MLSELPIQGVSLETNRELAAIPQSDANDRSNGLTLGKYSFGIGDRFACQAEAQLQACLLAERHGAVVIPVWNKSHREHLAIGSEPSATRLAAEAAVKQLGWKHGYHVDADHIRIETVDRFLPHADFYTIDVAEWIGRPAAPQDVDAFTDRHRELTGRLKISGIAEAYEITPADIRRTASQYLPAVQEAGRIYRHIRSTKQDGTFITEVSLDETDHPQTSPDLLIILAALADEHIPLQTIAPKFTGRFNKGVDYVGDLAQFEQEFNDNLAVTAFAVQQYDLPSNLKLSIHSGSDKFSLYAAMNRTLARFDAGLHLKTAGTTWLEELIGLAEADDDGLALAKEIYVEARADIEELCAPYVSVIQIDRARLPAEETVMRWSSEQFIAALRHEPSNPEFNPHLRQLLHVGYKVAARAGRRYLEALERCHASVSRNVTLNLYERHLKPLFLGRA
jgi:tagaturonate epimerase